MSNIIIAIAEGDVRPLLKPTFHEPIIVAKFTVYMRKAMPPQGVTEVCAHDIDAFGFDNIPYPYDPIVRMYAGLKLRSSI